MRKFIALMLLIMALGYTGPQFALAQVSDEAYEEKETSWARVEEIGGRAELTSDIELLPDWDAVRTLTGLDMFGDENVPGSNEIASVRVSEFKAESVTAADLLRSIPSIATENEETLGIVIPPFVYFAKKF